MCLHLVNVEDAEIMQLRFKFVNEVDFDIEVNEADFGGPWTISIS